MFLCMVWNMQRNIIYYYLYCLIQYKAEGAPPIILAKTMLTPPS